MAASPASPSPHLRVVAKVAHATQTPRVAAVVRFYLRGGPTPTGVVPASSTSPATAQRTFQFGELHAFLEAGRARAAVAGMLSLLPLDLGAECFQAWAGFISSVLVLAASRSRRRNLGGVIGTVRINGFGTAEGGGGGRRDAPSAGAAQARTASSEKPEATAGGSAAEDKGGGFQGCSCPICYEAFGVRVEELARTPCGHGFHRACIALWLRNRPTCPVCRFEMPKKVKRHDNMIATSLV